MAIDDNTNYTLTGAQVKDLAARIKAAGGLPLYVQESPGQDISAFYSDDAYTTPVSASDIYDAYAGGAEITVFFYDSQLDKTEAARVVKMTEAGTYWLDMIAGGYYCDYKDMTTYWKANNIAIQDVNNGTLTIKHNGTNVQTFSANQYSNAIANIETIWADDVVPATQVPPITSSLIDWSTMEHWSITLSGNTTVSQTTSYNYVDVPGGSVTANMTVGGIYLVLVNASVRCQGGSTDCYARVVVNGNNQVAVGVSQNPAAGTFTTASAAQLFTPSQASNTFNLQIGGGRANSDYMIAGGLISSVQIIRIA